MKVLIVNNFYKEESTGKIIYEIEKKLKKESHEVLVCFGRGNEKSSSNAVRLCGNIYGKINKFLSFFTGVMYGGCFFSTKRLKRLIKVFKPDVVNLHCINGNIINIYEVIEWLKNQKIRTVLTLHAEFMYTANCGYAVDCDKWITGCHNCDKYKQITHSLVGDKTKKSWNMMKKAFDGFDDLICVSVSPWLMNRAQTSKILQKCMHMVILNGIDTESIFYYAPSDMCKKIGRDDRKKILYVTSSFNNVLKGGKYVLSLAKMMPEYDFVIVGNENEIPASENVFALGKISNQHVLADFYRSADVVLLTSKKETFGMMVAESLCCGTPVVGFCAGAPEQITINEYSKFVPFGDMDQLKKALICFLSYNFNKTEVSSVAIQKYSSDNMTSMYLNLFNKIV